MFDGISVNILFFCAHCSYKVPTALNYLIMILVTKWILNWRLYNPNLLKALRITTGKFGLALSNKFSHLKDEHSSLLAKIILYSSVQETTKLDNQIKGLINKGFKSILKQW